MFSTEAAHQRNQHEMLCGSQIDLIERWSWIGDHDT